MFDKFGEFGTAKDINEKAEELFNDGLMDDIYVLAAENGIEKEMAEAYIEGDLPELCDITDAALGKIDVERADLGAEEIMEDWTEYIQTLIGRDLVFAAAVRRKGKSLKGCLAKLLTWSIIHQEPVDKEIIAEAKRHVKAQDVKVPGFELRFLDRVTLGIPGMGRAMKMIREYYLDGGENESIQDV